MIRKIVFVLCIACFFFGLNACKSKDSNQVQMMTGDNSRTCLDWEGTYSGVIPCADCAGIETRISLKMDNTYQISWQYLGKNDEIYLHDGTFIWDSTGSIIILENMDIDKYPTRYRVCENYLLQLDLNGSEIVGAMADKYILHKD